MAPLLNNGVISLDFGLIMAVLIGIGFGFTLERGGFGSARKLAAQFYLYDMTVFKVMFTAIITAMVGVFGLAKIGVLQMDSLYVNPTFIWPQLVGGLMLGAGFIISGYCPGTSLVASASGKLDGMITVVGVMAGIFTFGMVYTPELAAFHVSGSYGRLFLFDMLGLDPMVLSLIVVVFAGVMFLLAEMVEKKFSGWANQYEITPHRQRVRYGIISTLVVISIVFMMPIGTAEQSLMANSVDNEVSAIELASMIIENSESMTIIDIRTEAEYLEAAVPGSYLVDKEVAKDASYWTDNHSNHHLFVLVCEKGLSFDEFQIPEGYRVVKLTGGIEHWTTDILTAPVMPEAITSESLSNYTTMQAIYGYFTGAAVSAPKVSAPAPAAISGGKKKKKLSGGC
jgi:rhodanese-related sulfurtransferase